MYAPIALFVYKRPVHARKTVEALQKNDLAEQTDLVVFSDGPKTCAAESSVQEVRKYLNQIDGFKSIRLFERTTNFGLANSIIDGVTRVCDEYGRVIVVEDDLVTSKHFLKFVNDGLDLYEYEEKVISIHGYMYPVRHPLPETFFLRGADVWGWATWQRGWALFEPDGIALLEALKRSSLERAFNFDDSYDYIGMLQSQIMGKLDSWAIRWYASAFLENRLTLYPGRSLVQNIGIDSSGSHCETTRVYFNQISDRYVSVGGIKIEESFEARSAVADFFRNARSPLLTRAMAKVRNMIKRRQTGTD
jgi:hypothetical protein